MRAGSAICRAIMLARQAAENESKGFLNGWVSSQPGSQLAGRTRQFSSLARSSKFAQWLAACQTSGRSSCCARPTSSRRAADQPANQRHRYRAKGARAGVGARVVVVPLRPRRHLVDAPARPTMGTRGSAERATNRRHQDTRAPQLSVVVCRGPRPVGCAIKWRLLGNNKKCIRAAAISHG